MSRQQPSYLMERRTKVKGPLGWWYKMAAPPEPAENASVKVSEVARRGRLTSIYLLIIMLVHLFLIYIGMTSNHSLLIGISFVLTIILVGLFFNRSGYVSIAGLLVTVAVEISRMTDIITTRGGLSVFILPLFDALWLTELIAVTCIRPAWIVFPVALLNIIFTIAALIFLPHTADLSRAIATSAPDVFIRPIGTFTTFAIGSWLLVRFAEQGHARADRAEEISRLEHELSEKNRLVAEQKVQLDEGIQQILQTHVQVANGDFKARAPLNKENILWQIAYSLNNLIARVQRLSQFESEYTRITHNLHLLAQSIRYSRNSKRPLQMTKTGTPIDEVLIELGQRLPSVPSTSAPHGVQQMNFDSPLSQRPFEQ